MEPEGIQWKRFSIADISNTVNVYFIVEGKACEREKDRLAALVKR